MQSSKTRQAVDAPHCIEPADTDTIRPWGLKVKQTTMVRESMGSFCGEEVSGHDDMLETVPGLPKSVRDLPSWVSLSLTFFSTAVM